MPRVRYLQIVWLLASCALVVSPAPIFAQAISKRSAKAANSFAEQQVFYLVARYELSDPRFKESVVLMLPRKDKNLVVGLIVNKPTGISVHAVFPDNAALKNRADTVYFGGPVDTQMPGALFRSRKTFKQAFNVAGDLYVTFDSDLIEGILKHPRKVLQLRLFLGRSQWSPEQLQNEMFRRSWYSKREQNNWIFSPNPQAVWRTLIERLNAQPATPTAWHRSVRIENLHPPCLVKDASTRKSWATLNSGPVWSNWLL